MVKNRLTLYIFIALIAGIAVGFWYNEFVIKTYNVESSMMGKIITASDNALIKIKDTTTVEYKNIQSGKAWAVKTKKTAEATRDDKVKVFTLLNKYFLWLIKMIVGPLVFTTLVVGVAKVGDISMVGRIAGKTMLWFVTASLISLLLGMLQSLRTR
jgi:Na+/H+-dicarboxylate symporter